MPAGNLHKMIVPVDAEGLRFDKPADQVLWRKLTNVVLRNGFIETRPGLAAVGPSKQDLTNIPAPIVSLQESVQWKGVGTEFTGGTGSPTEFLVPDADFGGSWTGGFADIDESPPNNGSTKLVSTLRNDPVRIDFANPTNTYGIVDGVFIYVRARAPSGGQYILEIAKKATATTANNVSTTPAADIYANLIVSNGPYTDVNDETAEPGWVDFFVPLHEPTSNATDCPYWDDISIDAASVDVTLRTGTFPQTILITQTGTGSDNNFSGGTDAWKKTTGAAKDAPMAFFVDNDTYVTGTAGNRISLTNSGVASNTLLSTIDTVTPRFALTRVDGSAGATVLIYHRGTDSVRRTVLATVPVYSVHADIAPGGITNFLSGWDFIGAGNSITLNPETGLAWTLAEIKSGPEFGIEVVTGEVRMSSGEIWVTGEAATNVVEIDNMKLLVVGREFVGSQAGDTRVGAMGRIMATGRGFQRLMNEYPGGTDTLPPFEDISSAVSAPQRNMQPLEHTFFFDRIYWANGAEAPFFYEGQAIGQLTAATTPIGQSIWSFGQRLMQCDITETVGGVTTRHIKRVAYSGIAGPDAWQTADAGSLDLTGGGDGRARKGMALSQQVSAIYLDKGIYNLRWTGDSAAPFSPRLQDPDTGIIAPQTLQSVMDQGGTALHMFLGNGPQGVNIYAYDGNQAQPVGNDIKDELARVYRAGKAEWAFAELEPRLNLYMLFLPETGQQWPAQAWVFGMDTNTWVRWEFPFDMTCAGKWTLAGLSLPNTTPDIDGMAGTQSMVMGTSVGVPYKWDFNTATDFLSPRQTNRTATNDFYIFDNDNGTAQEQGILWDIQTGDLVISRDDVIRQTAIKRLWVTYEDRGFVDVEFSESLDGALTWINVINTRLGTVGSVEVAETDNRPLRELIVDFAAPTAARHHRIRMRPDQSAITNSEDFANARQKFKLAKLVIEYEDLGEAP